MSPQPLSYGNYSSIYEPKRIFRPQCPNIVIWAQVPRNEYFQKIIRSYEIPENNAFNKPSKLSTDNSSSRYQPKRILGPNMVIWAQTLGKIKNSK